MTKIHLDQLKPKKISDLSDEELLDQHLNLHKSFGAAEEDDDKNLINKIALIHKCVTDEMVSRGLDVSEDDSITKSTPVVHAQHEVHEPEWESKEPEADWSKPDLEDFGEDPDLSEVDNHFIISMTGFPPENFTDLKLPVVTPEDALNLNALQNAKARVKQVEGVPQNDIDRALEIINKLANNNFNADFTERSSDASSTLPEQILIEENFINKNDRKYDLLIRGRNSEPEINEKLRKLDFEIPEPATEKINKNIESLTEDVDFEKAIIEPHSDEQMIVGSINGDRVVSGADDIDVMPDCSEDNWIIQCSKNGDETKLTDMIMKGGEDLTNEPFAKRKNELIQFFDRNLKQSDDIRLQRHQICTSKENIDECIKTLLSRKGMTGLIIKDATSKYPLDGETENWMYVSNKKIFNACIDDTDSEIYDVKSDGEGTRIVADEVIFDEENDNMSISGQIKNKDVEKPQPKSEIIQSAKEAGMLTKTDRVGKHQREETIKIKNEKKKSQGINLKYILEENSDGDSAITKEIQHVRKLDDERQIVDAVVAESNKEFADGDQIPPEQIIEASVEYMKKSQLVGLQHRKKADASIVGSVHTPEDVNVWNGKEIKSPAWIVQIQVHDDDVWKGIKNGDITGVSLGGFADKVNVFRPE